MTRYTAKGLTLLQWSWWIIKVKVINQLASYEDPGNEKVYKVTNWKPKQFIVFHTSIKIHETFWFKMREWKLQTECDAVGWVRGRDECSWPDQTWTLAFADDVQESLPLVDPGRNQVSFCPHQVLRRGPDDAAMHYLHSKDITDRISNWQVQKVNHQLQVDMVTVAIGV